jgi:hypothetical protein
MIARRLKECDAGGQIEPPVLDVGVQINFHYTCIAEARNTLIPGPELLAEREARQPRV